MPLNADGTDSTFISPYGSSNIPPLPGEEINFPAIGSRVRIELQCQLSGDNADGTPFELPGSTLKFSPALFNDLGVTIFPSGTFPVGGYSIVHPGAAFTGVINMRLGGQGLNTNQNINGICKFVGVGSVTSFEVHYEFRVTMDMLSYPIGRPSLNSSRLKRVTTTAITDFESGPASVFTTQKSLTGILSCKSTLGSIANSVELMIPFRAAFYESGPDGISPLVTATTQFEKVSAPGVFLDEVSGFEDMNMIVTIDDTASVLAAKWLAVIVIEDDKIRSIADYEADYNLVEAPIDHVPGGVAQIAGPLYEPTIYDTVGTVKTVTIRIKASELKKGSRYEFISLIYVTDPRVSDTGVTYAERTEVVHSTKMATLPPPPLEPTIGSDFYNRGNNAGWNYEAVLGERITNVFRLNIAEYDVQADAAGAPFDSFFNDLKRISVEVVEEETGNVARSGFMDYAGGFTPSDIIGWANDGDYFVAYLKEFRIPSDNFQGLPTWRGSDYIFTWKCEFAYETPFPWGVEYITEGRLQVRGFENEDPTDPAITRLRFLNPETGFEISRLCDDSNIVVECHVDTAQITPLENAYVEVHVDAHPLGTTLLSDLDLEENSPDIAGIGYPPGVIFSERLTDLISEMSLQPDGTARVSFNIDVTNIPVNQTWRLYVYIHQKP